MTAWRVPLLSAVTIIERLEMDRETAMNTAAEETSAISRKTVLMRDAAVSLSLANLCFLKVWSAYLSDYGEFRVLMRKLPTPAQYLSTATDILILAALCLVCISWSRRRSSLALDRAFLIASVLLLGIILNGLRTALAASNIWIANRTWVGGCAALALFYVAVGWKWPARLFFIIRVALVCCLPFCAVTFGQTLWRVAAYDGHALEDSPPAPMLADARTSPRIVWIIFDAWDYRLAFVNRPRDLELPAADRIRAEFLSATDAHSPGPNTILSMPELMTGRIMRDPSKKQESNEQHARYLASIPLRKVPSIFDTLHERAYNISVIGWHIPYGRWFPALFADCIWWAVPTELTSTGRTFSECLWRKPISLLETGNYGPFGQSRDARRKTEIYFEMMAHLRQVLDNQALGFLFLHIPFPHPLHPYDRLTGRFDFHGPPGEGYVNSLALTDKILSDIRDQMERNGSWDKSVVVLSADHSSPQAVDVDGKSDPRVPFLLKLPGKPHPAVFTSRLNTIVTANLLLNVADGKIATTEQACFWLQEHGQDLEEPLQP